jgi:CBS domain-containing protein
VHHHGESSCGLHVTQLMSGNPVTCNLDDDVNEVMGKMSERRIAKVPVLHEGKLVGIVSVGDVIKVLYEKVSSENQHLMTYIHGSY